MDDGCCVQHFDAFRKKDVTTWKKYRAAKGILTMFFIFLSLMGLILTHTYGPKADPVCRNRIKSPKTFANILTILYSILFGFLLFNAVVCPFFYSQELNFLSYSFVVLLSASISIMILTGQNTCDVMGQYNGRYIVLFLLMSLTFIVNHFCSCRSYVDMKDYVGGFQDNIKEYKKSKNYPPSNYREVIWLDSVPATGLF